MDVNTSHKNEMAALEAEHEDYVHVMTEQMREETDNLREEN